MRVALSLHVAQTLPRSSRGAVVGESIEPYKCGEGSSFVSCQFSKNVLQLTIQELKAFAKLPPATTQNKKFPKKDSNLR